MIELPVYNRRGEVVGKVEIDPADFGGEVRLAVLRDAVRMYEAAQRVGTHSTLDRAHVTGSHRKPWRQKGTGHARAGFRRSPLWRGGSVVFGPHPREYRYAMPRKALQVAKKSAYLAKFQGGTTVVDELRASEPRTREVAATLAALGIDRTCLIAIEAHDPVLWKSTRNIPRVTMKPVLDINAHDLLRVQRVLITRAALEKLIATVRGEPAAAASVADAGAPSV
jgi:large subunit ribosomal protein L4